MSNLEYDEQEDDGELRTWADVVRLAEGLGDAQHDFFYVLKRVIPDTQMTLDAEEEGNEALALAKRTAMMDGLLEALTMLRPVINEANASRKMEELGKVYDILIRHLSVTPSLTFAKHPMDFTRQGVDGVSQNLGSLTDIHQLSKHLSLDDRFTFFIHIQGINERVQAAKDLIASGEYVKATVFQRDAARTLLRMLTLFEPAIPGKTADQRFQGLRKVHEILLNEWKLAPSMRVLREQYEPVRRNGPPPIQSTQRDILARASAIGVW